MTEYLQLMRAVVLPAMLALALTGNADAQPVSVVDSAGRTVQLRQPAQRIIALAPHIAENLFTAGAGKQLVGVVSYSDYPAAARQIPIVGGYHAFSLEKIVSLQPDLIVTWSEGNGADAALPFEKLGIPVYVDEPQDLEQVAHSIRNLGILSGNPTIAARHADAFMRDINALRDRYAQSTAVSVFYQVWNEPLQTVNAQHIISSVIELCGGRNIYTDTPVIAPRVSLESVIARDPDAIIASGMDRERPEWLDEWKAYPGMRAVRQQHLYFIPPDIIQRHTVRLLQGARQMCKHLQAARVEQTQNRQHPLP